jgi:hypothetical protein
VETDPGDVPIALGDSPARAIIDDLARRTRL